MGGFAITSKYISGTYTAGYTISNVTTSLTIGPLGWIAGRGLATPHYYSVGIDNFGLIEPTTTFGDGLVVWHGATITNGSSTDKTATISGGTDRHGIYIFGGNTTITNFGTIAGSNGPAGATATDRGGYGGQGVVLLYGSANIVNTGSIVGGNGGDAGAAAIGGHGGAGISLSRIGSITNHGLVAGGNGGVSYVAGFLAGGGTGVDLTRGGRVDNDGTIVGGLGGPGSFGAVGGVGVAFGFSGTGTVHNTGTIAGGVGGGLGGGAGIAFARYAIGTIDNAGVVTAGTYKAGIYAYLGMTISNAGTVQGGAGGAGISLRGGSILNTGTISGGPAVGSTGTIGPGVSMVGAAAVTLTNDGVVSGGSGVLIASRGTSANTIVNFGTLSGTKYAVSFGAGNDLLVLEPGSALIGSVANFHTGVTIDLVSFVAVSDSYTGNALVVNDSAGNSDTIGFTGAFATGDFSIASDGNGGTSITTDVDTTPPVEPQSMLPVSVGGSAAISTKFLLSYDNVSTSDEITYNVTSAPAHGRLLLDNQPTTSFTQADIDQGLVEYSENGDIVSGDSFRFTVTDAAGNTLGPESFSIAILGNGAPTVEGNNTLALSSDETVVWKDALCAVALNNDPDQMTYTIASGPQHGRLVVNGMPKTTFTQADIDDGLIWYASDWDGAERDSFSYTATDKSGERTVLQTCNVLFSAGGTSAANHAGAIPDTSTSTAFTFTDVNLRNSAAQPGPAASAIPSNAAGAGSVGIGPADQPSSAAGASGILDDSQWTNIGAAAPNGVGSPSLGLG